MSLKRKSIYAFIPYLLLGNYYVLSSFLSVSLIIRRIKKKCPCLHGASGLEGETDEQLNQTTNFRKIVDKLMHKLSAIFRNVE